MSTISLTIRFCIVIIFAGTLASCGSSGDSDSGGGQEAESDAVIPNHEANVVGPNMNGDTWSGYLKDLHGGFSPMTAVINHEGNKLTILTSLPDGLAHKLTGVIDGIGNVLLVDEFDGEDWTTLYGPVSKNSINLADFVFIDGHNTNTNIIILKR